MKKIIFFIIIGLFLNQCSNPYENKPSEKSTLVWPFLTENENQQISVVDNVVSKNYYVILDGSGSMTEKKCSGNKTKAKVAKEALIEWSKNLPEDAYLGFGAFDSRGVKEYVKLGLNNRDAFYKAIEEVKFDSDTPLKSAVELGYKKLTEQAKLQLGYGEYHLVIVTDGIHNPKSQDPTEIVNKILKESPIIIHTIGFCISEKHSLNQPGKTDYMSAMNPDDLKKGLQKVLAESEKFIDPTNWK